MSTERPTWTAADDAREAELFEEQTEALRVAKALRELANRLDDQEWLNAEWPADALDLIKSAYEGKGQASDADAIEAGVTLYAKEIKESRKANRGVFTRDEPAAAAERLEAGQPDTRLLPAGDIEGYSDTINEALSSLLELTAESLQLWDADGNG